MRRFFPVIGLLIWGCGQTRQDQDDDTTAGAAAQGASSSGGASSGSFSRGGASAGTRAGEAVIAGRSPGGAPPEAGSAGTAGTGDSDEPPSIYDCSTPYPGPLGGPRPDGPPGTMMACDAISDEVILARYDGMRGPVPLGLYYEQFVPPVTWGGARCATTPDELNESSSLGMLVNTYETDWFYEAELCQDGQRRLYRELRCDYFDGEQFPNRSVDDLAFLGSLLWWHERLSPNSSVILGYSVYIGDATDRVELCTLDTVFGNIGECDKVTLSKTTHLLMYDGKVTLGMREPVRTLQANCFTPL